MHAQVASSIHSLVHVLPGNFQTAQMKRQEFFQNIIVVSAQVQDFHILLFHLSQQGADKARMPPPPAAAAGQSPGIHNIPHQHNFSSPDMFQKFPAFVRLAVFRSQMKVRQKNRAAFQHGIPRGAGAAGPVFLPGHGSQQFFKPVMDGIPSSGIHRPAGLFPKPPNHLPVFQQTAHGGIKTPLHPLSPPEGR